MPPFAEAELKSFELNQYVEALKSSAGRARWALYVITVVSLLIALAEWNYLHASWSRQRWERLSEIRQSQLERNWLRTRKYSTAQTAEEHRVLDARSTPVDVWIANAMDREEITPQAEEFARRMILVPIPFLGASIHVNDLGLVGGVILVALAAALALLMAREYENLYLGTYKIRQLSDEDPTHAHGESPANLLYHALAMAQVLNDPPTLARWNQGSKKLVSRIGIAALFLLPATVQYFVFLQNVSSRAKAFAVWGVSVTVERLVVQGVLAGILVVLG